jgi:hypothetical protein
VQTAVVGQQATPFVKTVFAVAPLVQQLYVPNQPLPLDIPDVHSPVVRHWTIVNTDSCRACTIVLCERWHIGTGILRVNKLREAEKEGGNDEDECLHFDDFWSKKLFKVGR